MACYTRHGIKRFNFKSYRSFRHLLSHLKKLWATHEAATKRTGWNLKRDRCSFESQKKQRRDEFSIFMAITSKHLLSKRKKRSLKDWKLQVFFFSYLHWDQLQRQVGQRGRRRIPECESKNYWEKKIRSKISKVKFRLRAERIKMKCFTSTRSSRAENL